MTESSEQTPLAKAFELAIAHHDAGRLDEAKAIYRQILTAYPNHPDALHLLGVLALQIGHPQESLDLIECAIMFNPQVPVYYRNAGKALMALGRTQQAIDSFRRALDLGLADAETAVLLGNAHGSRGEYALAAEAFSKAIELSPTTAEAHNNLSVALRHLERFEESMVAARRAIELRPDYLNARNNLAAAFHALGRLEEAAAHYRESLALGPSNAETHCDLGVVFQDQKRLDEAIAQYRQALSLEPDQTLAHYNLGMALLTKGEMKQGLPEYEWRFKVVEPEPRHLTIPRPRWDGSRLDESRRLLIHAEQGFGDTLQAVRYLPYVAQRAPRLMFVSQPHLLRLLKQSFGDIIEQWCLPGEVVNDFELQCPVMSLPLVFRTTLTTIPASVPYLRTDPNLVAMWRSRLSEDRTTESHLNVGLVWTGQRNSPRERLRSTTLEALAPLTNVPMVRYISLQKGPRDVNFEQSVRDFGMSDWTDELKDFADTAALIENLDLVITIDTAVAHLAGALGKAVWALVPFGADWRWLLDRTDSPWYPTMRLFRQPTLGDWQTPIRQIADELRSFRINRAWLSRRNR